MGERTYAESAAGAERAARYGAPQIVLPRLGQGTFRVATLQAYGRACAVTHEHSLPVLEAAHILPHHVGGPNEVSNGILMRADLHRLFDRGYVTVTPDLVLRVSPRLRKDFDNGRSYYPLDEGRIRIPSSLVDQPSREHLEWHGQNVFLA
jgi:putative restriction endonuclease